MSRARRVVQQGTRLLLVAGVLLLAYAGYVVVDARAYQAHQLRRFEQEEPRAPASVLVDGDPIGEIDIPRLGIEVIVVQGESPAILQRAVGHVVETALPGEAGNVVLAGHRDTFFRPLKGVRVGDAIVVKTHAAAVDYRVESTRVVRSSDLSVLEPTSGPTLTLITCFPFSFVGSAPDRFIVRAREVKVGR